MFRYLFTKTAEREVREKNDTMNNEQLSKQESDILLALSKETSINQRSLSELTGYSLGTVNNILKRLKRKDFLNDNTQLTDKARRELKKKKPRNAIILAAGFGMRMVPINMTTPKALLEVYGERLIDRLIIQLQGVGITDIAVVVGFMKDSFEYLIDEFGVKLIYNEFYASKNNISSLACVADRINNTYILPCDIWCRRNPFRKEELCSWYMVSDLADRASAIRINRKMELVKVGYKDDGNRMIGVSYLTGIEAETVKNKIRNYSKDRTYDDKFWEEALFREDRMIVQGRVVHESDIIEINTYEQLRDLDTGSDQLKSAALETIGEQLNCSLDEITDIEILKKGMTNRSFLFTVRGKKFIMRIPGEGTDRLINRAQEAEVYQTISGLNLCDDLVYINPNNGYKITRYINNVRCCDPSSIEDLRLCMKKLRQFHAMKLVVPHVFNIYGMIEFYESLWNGQPSIYKDYKTTKANVFKLRSFIEQHRGEYQLTHIDAVPDNFLFDPNVEGDLSLQLTDWEYAGMQDKYVDIAMFCIYSCYDKPSVDRLIDIYFEDDGGCDLITRAMVYCYVAVSGLLWSNWCEYKRNLGVEFGEYSLFQYRYGKDFFHYATELIEQIGENV